MMVVLLIISIILAATAPIAAKKMARDMASGASAWIYTNNRGDIGYNVSGKDISAIIGTTQITGLPDGVKAPRLVLAGDTENPAFVFARRNGEYAGQINMTENQVTMNGLTEGSGAVGPESVAIGMEQEHASGTGTVAVGYSAKAGGLRNIAIGHNARAWANDNSIAIGEGAQSTVMNSLAIGAEAKATTGDESMAIGTLSQATAKKSIAIGSSASTDGPAVRRGWKNENSVAIGPDARTRSNGAVAVGTEAKAFGIHSTAIGIGARANSNDEGTENNDNDNGIAIGNGSRANANNCVAIGLGAVNSTANSILLGTENNEIGRSTVRIPGNLVVDGTITVNDLTVGGNLKVRGNAALGTNAGTSVSLRFNNDNSRWFGELGCDSDNDAFHHTWNETTGNADESKLWSDKRLKNIGQKYTSGLEAIKKLDIYNFTFKNDKNKTPQVGVIAQDLEKVFPNAVTKDVYGYLRIRWDEMFYAVINAVKELDTRVTELSKNVQSYFDRTAKLEATIEAQQKTIDDLTKRIEKLENK